MKLLTSLTLLGNAYATTAVPLIECGDCAPLPAYNPRPVYEPPKPTYRPQPEPHEYGLPKPEDYKVHLPKMELPSYEPPKYEPPKYEPPTSYDESSKRGEPYAPKYSAQPYTSPSLPYGNERNQRHHNARGRNRNGYGEENDDRNGGGDSGI